MPARALMDGRGRKLRWVSLDPTDSTMTGSCRGEDRSCPGGSARRSATRVVSVHESAPPTNKATRERATPRTSRPRRGRCAGVKASAVRGGTEANRVVSSKGRGRSLRAASQLRQPVDRSVVQRCATVATSLARGATDGGSGAAPRDRSAGSGRPSEPRTPGPSPSPRGLLRSPWRRDVRWRSMRPLGTR